MKKNRNVILLSILIISLIALLTIYVAPMISYSNINRTITSEAGTSFPDANDFFKEKTGSAYYISDITLIDINKPGVHVLEMKSDEKVYKVKLEIKDTIAPTAVIKQLDLYEGRPVMPEEFVESVNDATEVAVSLKTPPDLKSIGNQTVVLLLEDTSGNKSEYQTKLRISKTRETATVEASNKDLDIRTLLKENGDITDAFYKDGPFIPNRTGTFPINISINNVVYDVTVNVVDTVSPTGKALNRKIWLNEKIEAADFVTEIIDATLVTASFKKEPDYTYLGDQAVSILMTDEGNNQTRLEAVLTIEADTEPPAIYGAEDRVVYLNDPVSYKKGVYAIDNKEGEMSVTVDSSNVNIKKEGTYKVIYSAADLSGNTTLKEVQFTVQGFNVTLEMVEKLADEVLAEIITEDMTLRDKAWAIYHWIDVKLGYLGTTDKTSWINEAYNGLTTGIGDCFTYFSVSEILLTRAGIPVLRVERLKKEGDSSHYWHMINCGDGWYHFDSCVHKPAFNSFMLTDAEVDAYSQKRGRDGYYYRYDRSKYPATPEK